MNLLGHVPIDPVKPLELIVREEQKIRGLDANALMWVGPLKDIAEQGWVDGRQYSDKVWHEYFKQEYLPEDNDPEIAELAKEGYRKWDTTPKGNRILVGSTTDLLRKGFSRYLQQVEAHGAQMGVQFHAKDSV